ALVDRARDHLLARAVLARDQHRRVGGRDLIDEVVDLTYRRARADEVAAAARALDRLAQALDLAAQLAMLARAPDRDRERLDLDGLRDEIVRAGTDRTDGRLEAAKRGEHDHRHVRSIGDDVLAELEAR